MFAALIKLTAEHGPGFTVRATDCGRWKGGCDAQAMRSLRDRFGLVVSQQHYLGDKKLPLDSCLRLPDPADPSRSVRPAAREPGATTEPMPMEPTTPRGRGVRGAARRVS